MLNPQQSINSASSLNESSEIELIEFKINDIKVKDEYIQDVEIIYDGSFEVKGYIVVNDIYDLQTRGFLEPGYIINIKWVDPHKDEFERDFVIIKSTENKLQDAKSTKFFLQDVASWKLKNTFEPKSWESTTLVDVFNYVLNLEVKPLIPRIKIKTQGTRTLKNFCTPLHINFLDFISEEFRKEGVYFYQTRTEIIIGDFPVPETPKLPYKQTGAEDYYGFVIMEHYLNLNNTQRTNVVLPRTEFIAYDPSTKSVQEYKKDLNTYKDSMKTTQKVYNSQLTYKARHSTQEYLLDTTKYKHLEYNNNTQLDIIVPGNVKYSDMYKKIDVYLSGNPHADDTRETGDYKLSGKYIIYRIEDKVMLGQKFIQKLSLKRVSEGVKA